MTLQPKHPRILLAALIFSAATIPLPNNLNSIALILLVAVCLIQFPLSTFKEKLTASYFWIVPMAYFVWTASTYFWDTSGGFTVKELERYAIILFFPPLMAALPKLPARYLQSALYVFAIVTVVLCVTCLVLSFVEYRSTGDYRVFYYHYLSEQVNLNAIFLSNYCLASIIWLLYFSFLAEEKLSISGKIVSVSLSIFLLLMILLLSSKLVILLTLFVMIIFLLILGYVKRHLFRSIIIVLVMGVLGLVAVKQFSYLNWRFNVTEFKMYGGKEDDNNGLAIRLYMWQKAAEHILERPVLGYGLRGARVETIEKYREDGFELGVNNNYHAHNQYLESALMAGMPALLLLLALIFGLFRSGILQKNFLLLLLAGHFMIQCLFESVFEVQHELVFYIFFIFLLYYHGPAKRKAIN